MLATIPLLGMGLVMLSGAAAGAAPITCPATADISIDEWYPDENMNYKDRLILATNMNSHHGIARVLLRFTIPDNISVEEIETAAVFFSGCSHCGGAKGGTVRLYALNEPFDENSDTWGTLAGGDWDETVYSEAELPDGSAWNEAVDGRPADDAAGMDITVLLQEKLDKVRGNGLMLLFADEHQQPYTHQNVASRESEDLLDFAPFILINGDTVLCPAERALADDPAALTLLRRVRDEVLSKSTNGRLLIALYYVQEPFFNRLFLKNDTCIKAIVQTLRACRPLFAEGPF
ncbi:MAG: hypothetical protein GY868_04275 [Deltaproteobacteria bacterium]|nr:hypothetical protein [Deltaproteobacteria bacterium]